MFDFKGAIFDFKGAIFDLDGTLIDSMSVWEKIDIDFLKKRNIEIPADYIKIVNAMSFNQVAKYTVDRFCLKEKEEDIIKEWNDMAIYEYGNNIKLKPFVKEYLTLLKKNNIKIGLATASPVELYEPVLKNNGVYDLFDEFTSLNEVSRDKSYPDIYYLACEKLGLLTEDCIGFEDVLLAVKSMKSAKMKVIGVYDESSYQDLKEIKCICDKFIYNFKEML